MEIVGRVGSTVVDGEEEERRSEVERMKSKRGDMLTVQARVACRL
jgi:hypothetical protein